MNLQDIFVISGGSFTGNLVRLNSLDFRKWKFMPGMLFRSEGKWWPGPGHPKNHARRKTRHNGLDLRLYETPSGKIKTLPEETKVPLLKAGKIKKIIPDFLGFSVFAEHEVREAGGRLFTIYGHMTPEAGIEGRQLDEGHVIGKLAVSEGSAVPAHLHISIALVPENILAEETVSWKILGEAKGVVFFNPEKII